MKLLYQAAITSSDPISNTTPVGPVTIPDTDTVLDSAYEKASGSLAALLQPRKRDGTEMSVSGVAPSDLVRSNLDTVDMSVEVDLDATQVAEPAGKKWKKDDV